MKKTIFCIALLLSFSAGAQQMTSDTLDLEELLFVGFSKEKDVRRWLDQVPLDQIKLNPELSQNAGYE